jgi:hypothetical protein
MTRRITVLAPDPAMGLIRVMDLAFVRVRFQSGIDVRVLQYKASGLLLDVGYQ